MWHPGDSAEKAPLDLFVVIEFQLLQWESEELSCNMQ